MMPSLDFILQALGCGVLVPAAVVAVGLLLALQVRNGARVAVAAGLFAGFAALAAAHLLEWAFLKATSTDSWDRLPGLALLAVLLTPDGDAPFLTGARRLARLGVPVLTGWLLVRTESAVEPVSLWWAAGIAAAVLAIWAALDPAALRWPGFGLPALLSIIAFGAALVCELSSNLRLAHLTGVLAAVLAGCAAVGSLRPAGPVVRAAVPAVAVLLPGLLFLSWRNNFGGVPPSSYLLLLAAPVLLGAASLLPSPYPLPRSRVLLRVSAALVPLGAGLVLAALS
jgi:hypothetical protein